MNSTAHTEVAPADSALGRMASWCFTHRRRVVILWLGALVVVTILSFPFHGIFNNKFGGSSTESARAQHLLEHKFPAQAGDQAQVVFKTSLPVTDPGVQARINAVFASLEGLPHVVFARSPFQGGGQVSPNGHIAYGVVQFDQQTDTLPKAAIKAVVAKATAESAPGLQVVLGGSPISKIQKFSFGGAEGIGILAAMVILLLAFGSFIAMGLPIVTALVALVIAFGLIDFLSHAVTVPTFGTELAAMIGIGVGIDYALFVVTRYRQGLHSGTPPSESAVIALATSGRAVLFAGCTVVISLLGLFLLGVGFVVGLALGAITAVLLVMAGALTFIPALLGFAGPNIDRYRVPHLFRRSGGSTRHSFWWRWSRVVQRHPWLAGGISLAILLFLALPLFSMHLAFTDSGNDPSSWMTRQAYDLLAEGFGPGSNGPLVIAFNGTQHEVASELAAAIGRTPGIEYVQPPRFNPAGDAAVIIAVPRTSPQDRQTQALVHHLRRVVIPPIVHGTGAQALVGGETAASIDSSATFAQRLPWVIGGVVVLSFLLLMAVFRSVAVPIKAAIMNLLSIGAAYGVIVAVFQWGWAGSFFNIGKTGPIDPWIPLMLFTILFGLSMDYEVFLLSRMREEWRRTGDNATAVADGLAATARVITAAAAIMVCVFGSFVLGDMRVLKVFGLGLAVAVLIDATLVRLVLVPATMEILGDANWWLPKWLDRAVPTIGIEVDTGESVEGVEEELAGAGHGA
jgi:putative drug exporter of the RND superfamily